MAYITLNLKKLKANFNFLSALFQKNEIEWAIVTKLLCGNRKFLTEILQFDIHQVCDSRVSNLKAIKEINSNVETIYIKPPAKRAISGVVRYADISMNTEIETIKLLSQEAQKQNKIHKVIIMIELGELREGIMREAFVHFYEKIFQLKHIEVIGIGTNLSCVYGVLPNHDKLIQLSLYAQLIEAKFHKKIKYISGGSSVTIPLISQKLLPKGINHFRIGETLFLGMDVYHNAPFKKMKTNVFILSSEIIELILKPTLPMGDMGSNRQGNSLNFDKSLVGKSSYRAIIDIGLLDIDTHNLSPVDTSLSIVGASSDMFVVDLGENRQQYKVGDTIEFSLNYLGTVQIINSKYIDKYVKS